MIKNNKKLLIIISLICFPALLIVSPDLLKINGITPCWPVIFLLPFSLINNPFRSSIAGALLGIFIDSFTISDVSYIPSLLFLSVIWSKYGLHNKKIELFLKILYKIIFWTQIERPTNAVPKIAIKPIFKNNSIFLLCNPYALQTTDKKNKDGI